MDSIIAIKESPDLLPAPLLNSRFRDADYLDAMCHEVGTPLTSIIGLSHILTDVACSQQKKEECAEMLRDSTNMLMGLMKNMLDSSKLDAGKIAIEDIHFDVAKVVQEAVHIIAVKAAEKHLYLQVHVAEGLPQHCIGDPLRIRQILLNLLSNAIKFTEIGNVSLHVDAQTDSEGNDQLCMTVADTGVGIDEGALENIFGAYTQANASIGRKYGGTGLGLSISRNLAHLMHGDITVKSWPGMGSRFTLTLPLRPIPVALNALCPPYAQLLISCDNLTDTPLA